MLFAYRSGKNRITPRVWRKLERAEREAGLAPSFETQIQTLPDSKEREELLASASLLEIAALLGPRLQRFLLENKLDDFELMAAEFFEEVGYLAEFSKKAAKSHPDKELSHELQFFARAVDKRSPMVREWVGTLVSQVRELVFGSQDEPPKTDKT